MDSRPRRSGSLVPQRDAAYGHLGLSRLRDYRNALRTEEVKVSYWRRILQARLDVVRSRGAGAGAGDWLRPALTDARVEAGRTALIEVLPVDDMPALPSLAELWDRCVDPSDVKGAALLQRDLLAAEQCLSAYRSALHSRLSSATDELIARYHQEPALCLIALPLAAHPARGA